MTAIRPKKEWPGGTIVRLTHRSRVLENNPWEDPAEREVAVYLPAAYDESGAPCVALWDLAAYTNSGLGHLNWSNHGESLPERLDRLIGQELMPPAVVVMPDCYTSLGGNQYVNSPGVGRYADYLVDELVPFVASRFNVGDGREFRGVFGKSSGGYGALYHAMTRPETWGAAASHAGDVGFDVLFPGEFPTACGVLAAFDGDIEAFMREFWRKNRPAGREFSVMLLLAMAASYDPDPDHPARIQLPFDLHTCERSEERWSRWLSFDPLLMVEEGADALRSLRGLYIDVGIYDQYNIQFGTRRLVRRLTELGVPHHYEEFEGGHSGIDWRLDRSLPWLVSALKNGQREAN
ncbi:MAG: alpha/beta hydrolase-fold protein [Lysobacterales bacterium]|jgi:S-formylglutathione hydrolase FrmB